jgi:sporulation-control protein spo0M
MRLTHVIVVEEDDEQARMKTMLKNYNVTNMNLDHFITQAANNNAIYVDKIDIFPLDITISIGANNYYLPVMYVHSSLGPIIRTTY